MQVPVAGVEHVRDDQLVTRGDLVHAGQHVHELGPGHDAVVQVVVRRDRRHRAERVLAPLPDERAFGLVGGDPDGAGAVRARGRLDRLGLRFDGGRRAVDLDDQDRRCVGRVPRVREPLGRDHDAAVHHLDGGRDDAARDDPAHGGRAVLDGREVEQHRPHRRRERRQPNAHRGDDPERPLAPDHDRAQVVAGRLRSLGTQTSDAPVREDDVQRQHDGGDGAGDFGRRPQQIVDESVDRCFHLAPGAVRQSELHALARLAFAPHDMADALSLLCHALVGGDDLIEGVGDLAEQTELAACHAHREFADAHGLQGIEEVVQLGRRAIETIAGRFGRDRAGGTIGLEVVERLNVRLHCILQSG